MIIASMATTESVSTSRSDEKSPLTRELSDRELTELASLLAPGDYLQLGSRLGFMKARLDQIKQDNPGNIRGAMSHMLIEWKMKETGSLDALSKWLSDDLTAIGRKDLAKESPKEVTSPPFPVTDHGEPNDLAKESPKQVTSPPLPVTDHGDTRQFPLSSCAHHQMEEITIFCSRCVETACLECMVSIHKGHEITPIKKHRLQLQRRLKDNLEITKKLQTQIKELEQYFARQDQPESKIKSLNERIEKAVNESMRFIVESKKTLSRRVAFLEPSRKCEMWKHLSSQLAKFRLTLEKDNTVDEYYSQPETLTSVLTAINMVESGVSDEGVLSNIDTVELNFTPRQEMSIGRLEESSGWYLEKKIDLPEDKIDTMNACITLNGRQIAVGYASGGVDIIDIETQEITRVLDDIEIWSLRYMSGDRLIVCDSSDEIFICSPCFTKLEPTFQLRQHEKRISLGTDDRDNIYVGFRELKLIDVFDQSGGSPIKTIKTDLQPGSIFILKSGHIVVSQCTIGIEDVAQVIGPDGKEVCRIPGREDYAPFSTCDRVGNIYVVMQANNGSISIRRFAENGEFLESIASTQILYRRKEGSWLQVSSVSPIEFVVCDRRCMYVYHRRTTLTQLMTIMKMFE